MIRSTLIAGLTLLGCSALLAAEKPATSPYFEQDVAASNPLRAEQAKELDAYIVMLKNDTTRLKAGFQPDYSSVAAFEKSAEPYRKAFCESIGYPPPGKMPSDPATFDKIGEDEIGTYYRVVIPIVANVHAEGIYIVPKNLKGKAPLIISMHGGGGSPEVALFHGGANYHDMVRGGVKRGYIVFAPQHLFSAVGYPKNIRSQIDDRLRLVGTSLTAIEIAKITRSIDVLEKRPEVDATKIGMVGLSYGGYYALVTPAVDRRIKVSVSSCYYGVQEGRYQRDELSVPSDFRFQGRMTFFRDSDLAALVCPRALQIQAGSGDDTDHRDPGKALAPESAAYYKNLGLTERFQHVVFEGKHEFHDESAWGFVEKHLQD
jgi:dienelactone hydrolase